MTAAEILRRKADEYRAIVEEHYSEPFEHSKAEPLLLIETTLREVADALEAEEEAA